MLKENMILKIEEEDYRIIDFDTKNFKYFLISMKDNSWPIEVHLDVIEEMFNEDKIKVDKSDKYPSIVLQNIKDELIRRRDYIFEIVMHLQSKNNNFELYRKKGRKPIIEYAMDKYGVSYNSIKKYLIIYWKSGKCRDSLIPKIYNCGGKNKEKKILNPNIKRGRGNLSGVNIDEKFKKIFRIGINKYYNNTKKNTIRIVYELTLRDYIRENVHTETLPTYQQFYYWFNRITKENKKHEISKRYGDRIYQQTSRPIIGNSLQDALAPGELYQVDSTILDVYIVSKLNRNLIIGRPVLYLVIDVYSRMIVGMNVTIEPFNSYKGVKCALVNSMTDKVSYCAKYGIEIEDSRWNANCIPNRILADRGELLSGNIENAISNLGIMIQNTPPYRGDMKGIVEKSFERIHAYIKPFVAGVVENKFNRIERGAEDYRLKANLTLHEITKIIIKCVIFHNNEHVLNSYESDGLTVTNDIPKIPSKIWEYGIREKKGLLRELPEDVIKINLFNNKEVSVTAKGVRLNKLYYVSAWTLKMGWYQKARIDGSFKVRISYDTSDISSVYFVKEDGITFDILKLVSYQTQYNDLGEEELNKVLEYEKSLNEKAEEQEIRAKVSLYDEIEEITNNAKKENFRVKDKNISKSRRLSNIRENMDNERKLYRNEGELLKREEYKEEISDELDLFELDSDKWGDYYE